MTEPEPPFGVWKPRQSSPGCLWQAVLETVIDDHGSWNREFDWIEVKLRAGRRERRAAIWPTKESCQHRCDLLNAGLAKRGEVTYESAATDLYP